MLRCLILILTALGSTAHAQARLPLEGYFRPGRCIPVEIGSTGAKVRLHADGAVPTHATTGASRFAPFLILSPATTSMIAGDQQLSLRALAPTERLVGITNESSAIASQLFPGDSVIFIRLDETQPLPGPAMAWEALDAVILQRPLSTSQLSDVLASGTVVAVRSVDPPDAVWPWQRMGDHWVLRPVITGPTGALGGEEAYLPAQSWQPGQPAPTRRAIVLTAILVSLLVMSTLLIRSRSSIGWMLIIVLICCGAIEVWRRSTPPLRRTGGEITLAGERMDQTDRWEFVTSRRANLGVHGGGRPMLIDPAQVERLNLRLVYGHLAQVDWVFELTPDASLAFMHRGITTSVPHTVASEVVYSPLRELARLLYHQPGQEIAGATPSIDPQQRWPGVVIRRRPQ